MALNIEEIIASVKEASVLELNDLVKAIEEEFGVAKDEAEEIKAKLEEVGANVEVK
ncbi:ribosomal protein L7/L12 [Listeria monocytogenes]